jgi:hypothetical protein
MRAKSWRVASREIKGGMIPKVEALGFPAFATGSDVGLTPKRLELGAPLEFLLGG